MSQDGSWQEVDPDACGCDEASCNRRQLNDAHALIAALVLTYGEPVTPGHRRAGLGPDTMERAQGSTLSALHEPNSGAILIHVREG